MARKIRVAQFGLGPIGCKVTQFLVERGAFEIVAAVDLDPAKVGVDLGELAGLEDALGAAVTDDAQAVLGEAVADVAVVTTTSSLGKAEAQIIQVASHKLPIVSTCEELAYPWVTQPDIAKRIDAVAREHGVAILGTGVNPGFLMDFLPLALSGVCQRVDKVRVERVQDAQYRRIPFQRKIGAGLTLDEFQAKIDEGSLRHVGLTESMHMIASTFGWQLTGTEETIGPVVAERRVSVPGLTIEPGQALGVSQNGYAYVGDRRAIELVFRAAIGEPSSYERTLIQGTPTIGMRIEGGVNGDIATGAIVANAARAVIRARPGLRTMADMELVSYFVGASPVGQE